MARVWAVVSPAWAEADLSPGSTISQDLRWSDCYSDSSDESSSDESEGIDDSELPPSGAGWYSSSSQEDPGNNFKLHNPERPSWFSARTRYVAQEFYSAASESAIVESQEVESQDVASASVVIESQEPPFKAEGQTSHHGNGTGHLCSIGSGSTATGSREPLFKSEGQTSHHGNGVGHLSSIGSGSTATGSRDVAGEGAKLSASSGAIVESPEPLFKSEGQESHHGSDAGQASSVFSGSAALGSHDDAKCAIDFQV